MNISLKNESFILSISYGNYVTGFGGTDKVILAQQKMFSANKISHIHIFNHEKRILNLKLNYWEIIAEGTALKKRFYSSASLIKMLMSVIKEGKIFREIHLHHLLCVPLNRIEVILGSYRVPIKFYLHDYYTICTQYTLLKNNSEFCGSKMVSWEKCHDCCYYEQAKQHYKRIRDFLHQFESRLTFICPSDYMRKIWLMAYPLYSLKSIVVLHQTLLGKYQENCDLIPPDVPLRVAFVGMPSIHKGWHQWLAATEEAHIKRCNIRFFHFGKTADSFAYIEKVPVFFNEKNLDAMINALRERKIDCVVLWSIWPETYSYTYHESTAANAFILTNTLSGNIAEMVQRRSNGLVLENETELSELLCEEKRLRLLINNFKKSKNYGPLILEENRAILSLISDGDTK